MTLNSQELPQPYQPACGRYAPPERVLDKLQHTASVVRGRPSAEAFIDQIVREMRIRFYQEKTIKSYRTALRQMLAWFQRPPHQFGREDLREYLLYLVDAGASASWVSIHLSATRTAFDKMCGRSVTRGLATPRRPKRLPVVLSTREIKRLLESTPSLRDKLLLGLMYATGMRVSEVSRLRFCDLDFQRRLIRVWQGKGRKDRYVVLPQTFTALLQQLATNSTSDGFLFPGEKPARHISVRTIQRAMGRAVEIAGITKPATPHSLRHSFATHSFEDGCDIRNIQKLLGHANLDTTTIYVKVAEPHDRRAVRSPLDAMHERETKGNVRGSTPAAVQVGKMSLHLKRTAPSQEGHPVCKVTVGIATSSGPNVYLTGITATQARPGWTTLTIPPLEQWQDALNWLPPAQRDRIESPDFFSLLQNTIPDRFAKEIANR